MLNPGRHRRETYHDASVVIIGIGGFILANGEFRANGMRTQEAAVVVVADFERVGGAVTKQPKRQLRFGIEFSTQVEPETTKDYAPHDF